MTTIEPAEIADTGGRTNTTGYPEIKVNQSSIKGTVSTWSHYAAGTVPSSIPEVSGQDENGYVFRVGGAVESGRVVITLETRRITERARIRKVNQAIQRARGV